MCCSPPQGVWGVTYLVWASLSRDAPGPVLFALIPLNVYTGQNPRRPVVLIEIEPNAYKNYLSQTAGVILTFFGVICFCRF
jgi:hypothetical protein